MTGSLAPRVRDGRQQETAGRISSQGLSGLVATGPMTVAMALLYRRLPWWQPWSLPPREITANVLKSIGVQEHMSREAETVAITVGHFAHGTFAGAVYGALPVAIRRHALTSGSSTASRCGRAAMA